MFYFTPKCYVSRMLVPKLRRRKRTRGARALSGPGRCRWWGEGSGVCPLGLRRRRWTGGAGIGSSALRTREDTGRCGLRSQEAVDPLLFCICLLFVLFLDLHWNLPPRNPSSSSHPICSISVFRDFWSLCHVTHLDDLRTDSITPGSCPFSKPIVLIPSAILLRVLSPSCPLLQPVFLSLLSSPAEKSDSKQNKSKWAQSWKKIGKSELRGPSFSWEWNFGFYPRADVKLLLH